MKQLFAIGVLISLIAFIPAESKIKTRVDEWDKSTIYTAGLNFSGMLKDCNLFGGACVSGSLDFSFKPGSDKVGVTVFHSYQYEFEKASKFSKMGEYIGVNRLECFGAGTFKVDALKPSAYTGPSTYLSYRGEMPVAEFLKLADAQTQACQFVEKVNEIARAYEMPLKDKHSRALQELASFIKANSP